MSASFQFCSQLSTCGENFAQQATFLPVEQDWRHGRMEIYASKLRHSAGFVPVLNFNWKNLTVAQPLLEEVRDEMR